MRLRGRFVGANPYGKSERAAFPSTQRSVPRLNAYMKYQLSLARERVEEEIAASAFVRGAWRQLKERRTA